MSQPWIKFYPRDWRGDQALRAVSISARGFWMECLCIMHEATPRGHLVLNGKSIAMTTLARMAGVGFEEAETFLAELVEAGVCSVNRAGTIVSRRMIRDTAKSETGRKFADKRYQNEKNEGGNDSPQDVDRTQKKPAPTGYPPETPSAQKPEARSQRPEARKKDLPPANAGEGANALPVAASGVAIVQPTELTLAVQAFNEAAEQCPGSDFAAGWAKCLSLNSTREKQIRARLKEVGLDGWRAAVTRAARSDFLAGRARRAPGRERWGVDFTWLTKAENFTKLIEGRYDNDRARQQLVGRESVRAGLMDFLQDQQGKTGE